MQGPRVGMGPSRLNVRLGPSRSNFVWNPRLEPSFERLSIGTFPFERSFGTFV